MNKDKAALSLVLIIAITILLFFSSNIQRYIKFRSYCSSEAGFFANGKIEKDKGWLVESEYEAKFYSKLEHIAFFRFKKRNSNDLYDLRYVGGNRDNDSSYLIVPADLSIEPTYKMFYSLEYYDEQRRLKKSSLEIENISNGYTVAKYSRIYYSAWGGALGGPDWDGCPNLDATFGGEINALRKIFSE